MNPWTTSFEQYRQEVLGETKKKSEKESKDRWQDDDCDDKWYEKSDVDGKISDREKKEKKKHYAKENKDCCKKCGSYEHTTKECTIKEEEVVTEKISASGYARAKKWREAQAAQKDREDNAKWEEKARTHKWDGKTWNKRDKPTHDEGQGPHAKKLAAHNAKNNESVEVDHIDGSKTQIIDVVKAPAMVAAPKLYNWREDFIWEGPATAKDPKLDVKETGVKNKIEINPEVKTEEKKKLTKTSPLTDRVLNWSKTKKTEEVIAEGPSDKSDARTKRDWKGPGAPGLDAHNERIRKHKERRGKKKVNEIFGKPLTKYLGKSANIVTPQPGQKDFVKSMDDPQVIRGGKTVVKGGPTVPKWTQNNIKAMRGLNNSYEPQGEQLDENPFKNVKDTIVNSIKGIGVIKKAIDNPGTGLNPGTRKALELDKKLNNSYESEGEVIDERLGGKGYKPRKDSAGRRVSGDWENSDRGGGHKSKKRAGGEVEKKSPTYLAYVKNKKKTQVGEAKKKKDDTYLETDWEKRKENNEKARKDLQKGPQMKNPHLEGVKYYSGKDRDEKTGYPKGLKSSGGSKKDRPMTGVDYEKLQASYEPRFSVFDEAADRKMARATDQQLADAHKKFSGMDQSSPANSHMTKRVQREINRRKKAAKSAQGTSPVKEEVGVSSSASMTNARKEAELQRKEALAKKKKGVKEHHQKDSNGKVVEHGDGTPSSVDESIEAMAKLQSGMKKQWGIKPNPYNDTLIQKSNNAILAKHRLGTDEIGGSMSMTRDGQNINFGEFGGSLINQVTKKATGAVDTATNIATDKKYASNLKSHGTNADEIRKGAGEVKSMIQRGGAETEFNVRRGINQYIPGTFSHQAVGVEKDIQINTAKAKADANKNKSGIKWGVN